MSEMARELIQQALDQDYNNSNKTFGEIMSSKLSDALDQEQIRIADQIYNGVEPDDETDEDIMGDEDGDQLELDLDTEGDDEAEEAEEEIEDEDLDLDDEDEDEDEEDEEV